MQNHLSRIAVCAAGAVMVVACGSDPRPAATSGEETTTAPAVETAPPTDDTVGVTDTVSAADSLEGLLVTSVPEGYIQIDDAIADTGPSDLAKAVRADGGTDAEAVLTGAGFVSGYQRSWQTEDETGLIIVFLYQFSDSSGASSYGARTIETFDSDPTLEAVPFEVDGIPDVAARSLTSLEADGRLGASVVFTKNGYLVQIVVLGPTDGENQALAGQLALDQYNLL